MNKWLILCGMAGLLAMGQIQIPDIFQQSHDVLLAIAISLALQPWLARQFD